MAAGLDVTNLAGVKDYMKTSGSTDDNVLGQLIDAVSDAFEGYLGRDLATGTKTEVVDVYPGQRSFWLRHHPVSSVSTVWNDLDFDFTAGNVVDSSDYVLLESRRVVFKTTTVLTVGKDVLKFEYAGGMAADTGSFRQTYRDINTAANMQVSHWYQKIREEDLTNVSIVGEVVIRIAREPLLKQVLAVLKRHRNWM